MTYLHTTKFVLIDLQRMEIRGGGGGGVVESTSPIPRGFLKPYTI